MTNIAFFSRLIRRLIRIELRPFLFLRKWASVNRLKLCSQDLDTVSKHGFLIATSPSDWVTHRIFFDGEYDAAMSKLILLLLKEGDVVFDIGAQRGWFSLLMGKAVGQTGSVHAFEASPHIAHKLTQNVERNGYNHIRVVSAAVYDRDGKVGFLEASNISSKGHGSLINNSGLGRISYSADAEFIKSITIDSYVSDNKVTNVRLIKMDIEGSEHLALRGAALTISSCHPIIVLELNKEFGNNVETVCDICAFLESHEYKLFIFNGIRLVFFEKTKFLELDRNEENVWCFYRGIVSFC